MATFRTFRVENVEEVLQGLVPGGSNSSTSENDLEEMDVQTARHVAV